MDKDILFKEFEKLEALKEGDFIKIEEHGGRDESCLKGTRNALNHFASDIIKATLDNKSEYGLSAYFADDSVAGIVSIEIVELKEGKPVEQTLSFKDRMIGYLLTILLISFILSAVFGFITAIRIIFH